MRTTLIILLALLVSLPLLAQTEDLDKQIQDQSKRLKQLRGEIDKLNREIANKARSEQSTLKSLRQLERQIAMISDLQRELKKERRMKQEQIRLLESTLEANAAKIAVMKARYARRAVKAYKSGNQRDVELLLSSEDFNQAVRRSLYFASIHRAEEQLLRDLETLIADNTRNQELLLARLQEVEQNISEEERNARSLGAKQRQRNSDLKKIKQDRSALQQQVSEKQKAVQQVEGMITDLEARKQERLRELARRRGMTLEQAAGAFAKARGQLSWPVEGNVIANFGNQRNERLGTITNNPGIEISAPKGKPVRAVMDGIVVAITWIPSFGNTIILDHGAGYYTVYAHVDDIQIAVSAYVLRDQIIARVGDTGSLDGAKLHFEVWENETKVDPKLWLKK
jgi:septal ring factor EnvC (AmiA/AmiB activator)